jgi:hypothetical protein
MGFLPAVIAPGDDETFVSGGPLLWPISGAFIALVSPDGPLRRAPVNFHTNQRIRFAASCHAIISAVWR